MHILDRICAAVGPWLSFVTPALLLAWLETSAPTPRRAVLAAADLIGLSLAMATRGWYAAPDYAATPIATVSAAALLTAPALLSLALVHSACRRWSVNPYGRVMFALGAGYGMLFLMLLPSLLLFVAFGGDTL